MEIKRIVEKDVKAGHGRTRTCAGRISRERRFRLLRRITLISCLSFAGASPSGAEGIAPDAEYAATAEGGYRLPFSGRWFVMQGGDSLNVNHHMSLRAQWFGADFMKLGGPGGRSLTPNTAAEPADYYSWDAPVLSPAAGNVLAFVDGLPDNPMGKKDPKNPAGNHVVIDAGNGFFVFLAHFKSGSIKVRPGQRVAPGQELGRCGNSGNSDAPHVHMHVQDSPVLNEGEGRNMIFRGINAEMTGKTFENVDWPLIRGLVVWE